MANDEPKSYNAEVYLYSRALDNPKPIGKKQQVFKHHGIVIKYLDEDKKERLPDNYIYEGFGNERGQFIVERSFFDNDMMTFPGAKLKLIDEGLICKKEVEKFCDNFNAKNYQYSLAGLNCQEFASQLLTEVSFKSPKIIINDVVNSVKYTSINSSKYIATGVWSIIEKYFFKWLETEGIKEGIKIGATQITNELAEGLMRQLKGAFTPWQLFQIPVEIITKLVVENGMKKAGYEKELSEDIGYATSKLASLGVAIGVGFISAPWGPLAAVGFWLAAEIVTYLIRKVLEYSQKFTTIFGKSPNERCFERFRNMLIRVFAPRFKKMFTKAIEEPHKAD